MSFIKQTYEYRCINILIGHSELILIADVVIKYYNSYIYKPFSPNITKC